MKPGASNPNRGVEKSLQATKGSHTSAKGFRVAVTTAGELKASYVDTPDDDVTLYFDTGVSFEPGEFADIWKEAGSTIVTDPADTIIAYSN